MLGHRAFWTLALAFGLAGFAGCGGGTSSSSSTPPPTTYTVTATAGTGTTITPSSTTVQAGATASFTVGLQSGYQNLVATGCTISGTTCTTGAINANATVTLSATAIPTYTVTATAGTGTTISPTSATVQAGATATFTVGLQSGYQNLVATGCTISGTTCTTGAINANATVTLSATANTYTATVSAGTGITSVTPASQSGTFGSVLNYTIVVAYSYANPTITGCTGTITGSTLSVTVGSANCTGVVTATAPGIDSVKETPFAVFDTDTTTTLIEVAAHGTGVRVWVTPYTETLIGTPFEIKDNGQNGDVIAGDGIFSASYTWTNPINFSTSIYQGMIGQLNFGVSLTDSTGNTQLSSSFIQLGVVKKSQQVSTKQITTLAGNTITAAPNAVFINAPYGTARQTITNSLYSVFPDVFDGIVLVNSRVGSASQDYVAARQPLILGIGNYSPFDLSGIYGSSGKILGVTDDDGGDVELLVFNHEDAGHMMGAFHLIASTCSGVDFTGGDGNHMRVLSDSVDFTSNKGEYLSKQKNGDYIIVAGTSNGGQMTQFLKYITGFGPATLVPPTCSAFGYTGSILPGTTVPASAVTCYTIQQIQNMCGGARSPDYTASQKNFQVLFAWEMDIQTGSVSTPAPTVGEIAFGNTIATYYAGTPQQTDGTPLTFTGATGTGTLVTAVPPHK